MSANTFVYNEQLVGTVDGVNKTFTALHSISDVESLRIGGVEYSDFSFTGNTVTLADAPTVVLGSPYLDYFWEDGSVPSPTTDVTLDDVIDYVYGEIGQTRSSRQFPIDLVTRHSKDGIKLVNNMRVNPKTKVGRYSFNKASDCTTSAYSATSVPVGAVPTYAPSQGALVIKDSGVVKYSTVDSDEFKSLSGLDFVYESGEKVSIGYKLPAAVKNVSEVLIDGKPTGYVDFREFSLRRMVGNVHTVYWDNGTGYLFLPYSVAENARVAVHYVIANSDLVGTSAIDLENDYAMLPALYACWNVFRAREDARYGSYKNDYAELLGQYKSFLRNERPINNTIPTSSFSRLRANKR